MPLSCIYLRIPDEKECYRTSELQKIIVVQIGCTDNIYFCIQNQCSTIKKGLLLEYERLLLRERIHSC